MKRDPNNAVLAGVCAGLAKHLGVSALLMRVIFIIGTLWLGAPLLIYILLAILMPPERAEFFESLEKLHRDDEKGMIGGVCAGIANVSSIDVTLIRGLWIISAIYFGFGIIPYVILWILLPKKSDEALINK